MLAMQESIQNEVVSKLSADRNADSANIEVNVVGSNVILSGTVPSPLAHRTIIRDVWCVANVSAIVDKLALGNSRVTDLSKTALSHSADRSEQPAPQGSDPSIPARVTRSLEQSECLDLDPCAVEVVVDNGTVTLEGMVPSRAAVRAALAAASRTPGVGRLRNRLILAP